MITQQEVILIIGMMLVTFAARYPLMVLVGKIELPEQAFRALRYVPVAVLTAIVASEAFYRDSVLTVRLSNAYLYAGIITLLIAWRTKNLLMTIIGGMIVFFLWRMVFGG